MLRASMRACTMKRKWNKKGQLGKNPHTTLNKRILSVLVSVFSLTLSLESLLPSVSREMASVCSSCTSRGGRGALSLSLLLMMMVMVMMTMQNRSPMLNVVFEDGGESAADVKQQSSTRKRKRAVDDANILPMPESNDPLASKRGEGAVKLKNDNNDIRNTSEKHWMEEIFRARDRAGLVGPKACKDVHFGTIERGKTRGNHRHRGKAETFAVFGNANGIVRVERETGGGYTDYSFSRGERVLVSSPRGLGHAVTNSDEKDGVMVIVACSDEAHDDDGDGMNDYQIWDDL